MALITRSNILYFLVGAIVILYAIYNYNEQQMKKRKEKKKEGFESGGSNFFAYIGLGILGILVVLAAIVAYVSYRQRGVPPIPATSY